MAFEKLDLSNRQRSGGRNVVFLYGYSESSRTEFDVLLKESGIDEYIIVNDERSKMRVKALINSVTDNEVESEEKEVQVVLFNGISQYELQQFITGLRSKIQGAPYIAMVTKTSKEWYFKDLIAELIDERNSLKRNG